jgi:hypothetical protein
MGLGDNVCCDYFADALAGSRTSIDSGTDSGHIAAHNCSHQAGIDLFPADESNVRGFHHRVGSFNHRHQAATFDHSECFRHQDLP